MPLKKLLVSNLFLIALSILFAINITLSSAVKANEIKSHVEKKSLPIFYRLAFMTGHVEAGIELYKLNELKMAAPHLLHPVSEIHIAERKGLDKLGFKGNIFKQVSSSLENNLPAIKIEPLLKKASSNLNELAKKAGGDSKKIVIFLLQTTLEEYDLSLKKNKITNIGEYQDAWGFVKVAMYHAAQITDDQLSKDTLKQLRNLHQYWANGPLPTKYPTELKTIRKSIEGMIAKLEV